MSQPPPPPSPPFPPPSEPPSGSDPQIPAPPPPAPPPGYYAEGAAPSAPYAPQARWRSVRGITTALTWLFATHIVLTAVLIIGVFNHLRVLSDKETGGLVFDTKAVNDANGLAAAMIILSGIVAIAIFVLLIIWLYRAAKNNEALGRQNPRLGPGWALGRRVMPFGKFRIPFHLLDDRGPSTGPAALP